MRRYLVIIPFLIIACGVLTPISSTKTPSSITLPTSTQPQAPKPTRTPSPLPTPIPEKPPSFIVYYHPDSKLYIGDLISFEIVSSPDQELEDKKVQVRISQPISYTLGSAPFNQYGIGKRFQASLQWIWHTTNLQPGQYQLTFSIQPGEWSWTETVTLYPNEGIPLPQPKAHWETLTIPCCIINYITHTDAARDMPHLLQLADEQAKRAVQRMNVQFDDQISITLLPRVLGHGGFAGDEIYVSYLEQNYAGNDFSQVLHHEMIHILDAHFEGELRPSILVEGLAVYLSGGHFKVEPLTSRAAALLSLGWYLPLDSLADDFYNSQHEVGYLEGGALVAYMVHRWGWQVFWNFYHDIHPQPSNKQSDALDIAMQKHFGLTLAQVESQFLSELYRQQINPDDYDDVRLSVAYYDTVRRYQQLLDPSAYFLTAWLPSGNAMRERGLVADYLRHPQKPENLKIESLLIHANQDLLAGNYLQVEKTLWLVKTALDAIVESQEGKP